MSANLEENFRNIFVFLQMLTKKRPFKRPVGIKNSWKYEKDLILILNVIKILNL